MLQCVADIHSVLTTLAASVETLVSGMQCVAVCCSVLQCVAVYLRAICGVHGVYVHSVCAFNVCARCACECSVCASTHVRLE